MKKYIVLILILCLLKANTKTVSADISVAGTSANLSKQEKLIDRRVILLKNFLNSYNSPLAEYSDSFIKYADLYGLDWRLVAAISGVESTFGKHIPKNSYNAYGWANGNKMFSSWDESIYVVSRSLSEKYIAKGANTIDKIGKIYAPPSKTWSYKVKYFMEKIEKYPLEYSI